MDKQVSCLPGDDVTSFMETDSQSKQRYYQDHADDETNHRQRSRVTEGNDDDENHDGGTGSDNEMEFVIVRDEFPDDDGSCDTTKVDEIRPKNKFLLSPLGGLTTDSSGKEEGSESVIRYSVVISVETRLRTCNRRLQEILAKLP